MTGSPQVPNIVAGDPAQYAIEEKKMYLEAGVLGKLFGTSTNAPTNVAGVVSLLLVISGVGVLVTDHTAQAADYFKVVSPLITLALGTYLERSRGEFHSNSA